MPATVVALNARPGLSGPDSGRHAELARRARTLFDYRFRLLTYARFRHSRGKRLRQASGGRLGVKSSEVV